MKEKKQLRIFTIAEGEKEEQYLQKRHREGWKFTKVSLPGFYHFEKCTPENVTYQLDYDEEGLKHKDEYVQLFKDCGWEYIQDFGGYSYFRKPVSEMQGEEEIFCDDESRLDMMQRVFAGRYLPILIILMLLIVPNLFEQFQSTHADAPVLLVLFLILLGIYARLPPRRRNEASWHQAAVQACPACNRKGSPFGSRFTGLSKYQNTLGRGHDGTGNQFKSLLFHFVSHFLYSDGHFFCLWRIFDDYRFVHRIHLLSVKL